MPNTIDFDPWKALDRHGAHLPNVLLYGPPGTGKTHLALTCGLGENQEVRRVNFTEDTPAAEVRGHYVPRGANWEWHDGPALEAFRHGWRLVADEITRASDDCLSFMLSILDGHAITLPSGERVSPHPDFSCWATTNDTPEALTDALADRLTIRVNCATVNPRALTTLPKHYWAVIGQGADKASFREMTEFVRQTKAGVPDEIAAKLVWDHRADDIFFALCAAAERK